MRYTKINKCVCLFVVHTVQDECGADYKHSSAIEKASHLRLNGYLWTKPGQIYDLCALKDISLHFGEYLTEKECAVRKWTGSLCPYCMDYTVIYTC